jgi:alkylation response protein AidB-like acyl-CoA dehydrogenase
MGVLLCNAALWTLSEEQAEEVEPGRWAVLVRARGESEVNVSEGRMEGFMGFAPGAHGSARVVVLVDGEPPQAWLLEEGGEGVEIVREVTQMGLRGAPAASIRLSGASCTRADGHSGQEALDLVRAGTAAIARGVARRAREMALEYAGERRQGGVAIIEHEAVSDMLSAMRVREAYVPGAGGGGPCSPSARALTEKIAASEAAMASTTDAVQVFGGTGYMVETGVEKLMRDAEYCRLFPEPNHVGQRELMALERVGRR